MTKEQIIADLDYASTLAKEGAQTPLMGGPIGLMWGILLTVTLFTQWLILSRILPWSEQSLGFLWLAFAVIGGLGSFILGRRIDAKPGSNSVANRVETYVWLMFVAMTATLFIGIILNLILQESTPRLFDLMPVIAFAGQGLAYGVVANLTKLGWVRMASLASFAASMICFAVYGTVDIYLIAAIGAIFTIIIPSLISIKKAG